MKKIDSEGKGFEAYPRTVVVQSESELKTVKMLRKYPMSFNLVKQLFSMYPPDD